MSNLLYVVKSLFLHNLVGKDSLLCNFLFIYNKGYLQMMDNPLLQTHKISSQDCIPSLRLGLALCIVKEMKDLNFIMHLLSD
jgi:hypothetical protein